MIEAGDRKQKHETKGNVNIKHVECVSLLLRTFLNFYLSCCFISDIQISFNVCFCVTFHFMTLNVF